MITATLEEIGHCSLDVEIEYQAYPGEPQVMYYPDGSGYPGYPPTAELTGIRVTGWCVEDDDRSRNGHWIWEKLDEIACGIVERKWDRFETACLEDAHEREEEGW